MAWRYGDEEVDHGALIARLVADYDGWALSLHVPSLRAILPLCPESVRICAWVKPFASWKPGNTLAYAWEIWSRQRDMFRDLERRGQQEEFDAIAGR